MLNKSMKKLRQSIAEDKEALPRLHKEAVVLGLQPQPWWDRDFYEFSIRQARQ